MIDLYSRDMYCMDFTNKELEEYLVAPLRDHCDIIVESIHGTKEEFYKENDKISCIFFDGDSEQFFISFYQHQTSICITDSPFRERKWTFNEEFMFIDDAAKTNTVSSDTYGNIVYEGSLRAKTHKEILELFCEFILLLVGATSIRVEETQVSQEGWQYPKCKYVVKIKNDLPTKIEKQIENIQFQIN